MESEFLFTSFFSGLRIQILSLFKKLRRNSNLISIMLVLSISKWSENWQIRKPLILTPTSRGTRRSPPLNQAETALVVTPLRPHPKWSPTILGVVPNSHVEIRITLNCVNINPSNAVLETLPIYWFD